MFPNFRLMIAATLASIMLLICGFGAFAVLRVSHEPLLRLPPAAARKQLVADAAATLPLMAAEPLAHRFQIDEREAGGISALAYAAVPPGEQPPTRATEPAVDDHERGSESQPVSTPADSVDAPPSSQQATAAQAAPETKPQAAGEASGAPAAPSPPSVASIAPAAAEPPAAQARSAEQTLETEIAPASSLADPAQAMPEPAEAALAPAELAPEPARLAPEPAQAKPKSTAKVREQTSKRTRVAAKAHQARRMRTAAVVQSRAQAFADSNFQTAPAWQQRPAQKPSATSRRSGNAARTTGVSSSATGGPFVSAPSR